MDRNKGGSSQQAQADITLILKCTRRCNLRCSYCTDRSAKPQHQFDIPFVAHLFEDIRRQERVARATFIWHGGEPLLLGIAFFRKVFYLQQQMLPNMKFINTVQTNATLLNRDWLAHFADYDFQVGVSCDGPQEIHDSTRPFANGRNSYERVAKNLELLQKAEVNYGLLTVVSERHLQRGPEWLMDFFERQSIARYALLSLRGSWGRSEDALAYNRSFGDYMAQAVRYWLKKDDTNTAIREIESKMDLFFGLPNSVCKDGGPCVGKYFGVEADGRVWHCDKFFDDDRFYFGNFLQEPLGRLIDSERVEVAARYESSLRQQCEPCAWFHLCRGGCLADLVSLHKMGGRVGTPDCINFSMYAELSTSLADVLSP